MLVFRARITITGHEHESRSMRAAQAAELFVVDQLFDRRMIAAQRAVGVAAQFERVDLHGERVEAEQSADKTVALA